MSQQKRTAQAVERAVAELEVTINSQTENTIREIDKLELVNRTHIQKYAELNEAAEGLCTDGTFLRETASDITKYVNQIDDISTQVTRLQELVAEMDEWSRELSIKVQRL